MKANNSYTCWLLGLVLCLALNGCSPRAAQLPNHVSNSVTLANLGPKVGEEPAPQSLQITGQAPGDYSRAKTKIPNSSPSDSKNLIQTTGHHAKIGEPGNHHIARPPAIPDVPALPPVPPEIPVELPKVPPQGEEGTPLQVVKHQVVDITKLPPPLPVPTAQKALPRLPDQPPIPPVEQVVEKKPLPELPSVPPNVISEKKLPELPPAPPIPEPVKKLPELPPPAPVPSQGRTEPLPSISTQVKKETSAPPVIVIQLPPKNQQPLPSEPVKPAAVKNGVAEPPAPLSPEVKYQTEEPPPLLQAKPLPVNGLQPVSANVPGKPAGSLETLHKLATESYATIDSYIVRFRRKEQVGGKDMPEELMLFKFHKKPFSVYFKWLGSTAKGREVVYVNGRHGNKLHTLTAAGDVPFIPPGKRMSFSIDSPLVRAKSRHSINEAGVGKLIERFGNHVEDMKRKDFRFGSLKYLGQVKRPEFENPVEAVLHIIPPKVEAALPQGGRRFWYFDTKLRFPVLLITFDEKQNSVEYYCYDRWLFPGRLSEDEFNPNVLWQDN